MPEWHIEFADRLRHQSGRGNIQRARVVVERESRLNRNRGWHTGCRSRGKWSCSSCYNRINHSCIRMGIRCRSYRSKDNPSNNRRSMGIRHNILRRMGSLFRHSKKSGSSANRVHEY
jgi:hypothetical protein